MRKNSWAKLILTFVIGTLMALSVFAGCKKPVNYTVTFDSNGGSSVPSQLVESGKTATEPEDPTRDGYDFACWLDGNKDEYDFSTPVTENIRLFAKWNLKSSDEPDPEKPQTYTVKFIDGSTELKTEKVESGKTVAKPAAPTKDGYTFEKWILSDGSDFNFATAITKDTEIYAKWTKNQTTPVTEYVTVKFMDGTALIKSERIEKGETVSRPATPTKDGYTFEKWILSDGSDFNFATAITADINLYAKWTKNQTTPITEYVTVKFMDGTSEIKSERIEKGETVSRPTTPTKDGYSFEKWILSDGSDFNFATAITKDTEIYAKWTKNTTPDPVTEYFTVTFNSNSGSAVLSQYVEKGKKAAEPSDPTRSGYIFDGWYKEAALTNSYDFNTAVTADITLYAKWTPDTVTTYTVTFNSNGGSNVISQEVTTGKKATEPAAPEKSGYVFGGWYTTNALTALYDFNAAVTADITLYAKWTPAAEAATYEVTFNSDGGSSVSSQEVDKNGKAAKPKDPTKSGYTFDGWYNGNTLYNFNTPVTSNLTLKAKWKALPAGEWKNYQADFTDSSLSSFNSGNNKTKADITVGRFTFGTGVYFEGADKGLSLEKGNINTQSANAVTFTLNGKNNKNVISFKFRSAVGSTSTAVVELNLYKKGITDPIWSLTATTEIQPVTIGYDITNNKAGEVNLTEGTYYIKSSGGAARLGDLIISEYIGNESAVTPPASSTLSVPEIPADATKIQVSSTSTYKTIASALAHAATLSASDIKVIEIADGEYKEKLTVSAPNVWLVGSALADGESLSATKNNGVVIWFDDISETAGGTDKSASVTVSATDFVAINITFKNYYNTHELYQQSYNSAPNHQTQAVALNVNADRASFYNCKVTSYHDTLLANRGKQLYYNCWIEGKTDYIFGQDAIAYFESCDIWTIGSGTSDNNGGYVVAQNPSTSDYYYVFNNCRFDGDANVKNGSAALGRPWGAEMKMVVMNSYISGKFSKVAHTSGTTSGQRYCTMSGREPKPANMIEYNNTGDGAITSSIANTCTYITENDAKAYTLRNVLTMNGWNVTGDEQDLITFGSTGNYNTYKANGKLSGTATISDNGANSDNSQVKQGYLSITVTEGAVVTISSFKDHTNYTVTINGGTPTETITGTSWKYVATGNDTIVITSTDNNNYIYYISILY